MDGLFPEDIDLENVRSNSDELSTDNPPVHDNNQMDLG